YPSIIRDAELLSFVRCDFVALRKIASQWHPQAIDGTINQWVYGPYYGRVQIRRSKLRRRTLNKTDNERRWSQRGEVVMLKLRESTARDEQVTAHIVNRPRDGPKLLVGRAASGRSYHFASVAFEQANVFASRFGCVNDVRRLGNEKHRLKPRTVVITREEQTNLDDDRAQLSYALDEVGHADFSGAQNVLARLG